MRFLNRWLYHVERGLMALPIPTVLRSRLERTEFWLKVLLFQALHKGGSACQIALDPEWQLIRGTINLGNGNIAETTLPLYLLPELDQVFHQRIGEPIPTHRNPKHAYDERVKGKTLRVHTLVMRRTHPDQHWKELRILLRDPKARKRRRDFRSSGLSP